MEHDLTLAMRVVARARKRDLRDDLMDLYHTRGLTQAQVAAVYLDNESIRESLPRLDGSTIKRWMDRLGIPARRQMWVTPEGLAEVAS